MFERFGRTLTFELVADGGVGLAIGDLLADASDRAIQCDDERIIGGYAAYGQDIAAAIEPLVEAFSVELHDDGDVLRSPVLEPVRLPTERELGASTEIIGSAIVDRQQAPASSVPAALALSYYDPARDYQTGQARVSSPAPGRVTRALTLPCVLGTGAAKEAAENLLLRAWALRERLTIRLPLGYLEVRPGALIRLPGIAGDWVTESVDIERLMVTLTLRAAWAYAGSRTGDPGQAIPQPDVVAAATRLALFDLPDPATSLPTLVLAASSPGSNWRSVPIAISAAGSLSASRTALREAVLGQALTVLGAGQEALFDQVHPLVVQLANPEHWLESRDDAALAMGANLAMIGDEMIQFGEAEALAPGGFRLSRLLRGRRGSEWAMSGHVADENFVLLDTRTLKVISVPVELLGSTVTVTGHGPGNIESPPSTSRDANGEAMRPLSPAHLQAHIAPDGTLAATWIQRSRLAWPWLDEIDSPVDPSVQGYRLQLAGVSATIERDFIAPTAMFAAAEIVSLGAGPIELQVRQIGATALSRPATFTVNP